MPAKNCQSKNCSQSATIHNKLPPVTNCDQLLLPQVHLMVSIFIKSANFLLGGRLEVRGRLLGQEVLRHARHLLRPNEGWKLREWRNIEDYHHGPYGHKPLIVSTLFC